MKYKTLREKREQMKDLNMVHLVIQIICMVDIFYIIGRYYFTGTGLIDIAMYGIVSFISFGVFIYLHKFYFTNEDLPEDEIKEQLVF